MVIVEVDFTVEGMQQLCGVHARRVQNWSTERKLLNESTKFTMGSSFIAVLFWLVHGVH